MSEFELHDFIAETLQQLGTKERQRLGPRFERLITDLLAITELLDIVQDGIHRSPRPSDSKEMGDEEPQEDFPWPGKDDWEACAAILQQFYEMCWPKGPKNRQWLEQSLKCRSLLNKCWQIFRLGSERANKDPPYDTAGAIVEETFQELKAAAQRDHIRAILAERKAIEEREKPAEADRNHHSPPTFVSIPQTEVYKGF
jgi:hypothetical protein